MDAADSKRAHLIVGGFPPGSPAGHDMDLARLRILQGLGEDPRLLVTTGNDYSSLDRWLSGCQMLVTYTAGPFANDEQCEILDEWLRGGGRWLALHGSSGGKAVKLERNGMPVKQMVKSTHHVLLGCFFLNHPPLRRFEVRVRDTGHPLTRGLPERFQVVDELYLVELQQPAESTLLLSTELDTDPSPPGFGFVYDRDTSVLEDGKSRALGYEKRIGEGAVAYIALGHCHRPATRPQRLVDDSALVDGDRPQIFHGVWDDPNFATLLRNGIAWGSGGG
ncbi:MAG: ThuA domain-containing protein [Gammaproteobacteria bacterium]|nr:ThuA domain-containing protein [Gammaproteobacteria bacterium]